MTVSGAVKVGYGVAVGVVINSHTGGSLKLWDSLSAAGTVLNETITFAVGERFIPFYSAGFQIGLFATIAGTANITVMYK